MQIIALAFGLALFVPLMFILVALMLAAPGIFFLVIGMFIVCGFIIVAGK